MKDQKSLFQRLTNLFKSGPVVKRKIRGFDTAIAVADKTKSSGALLFQKSLSPTYATITANAYNMSERLMRYQDFTEMEYTPEIAAALDLYADETAAQDDKGRILHIHSDNEKIKEVLEDLYYNTLNIEFNLRPWTRNLPVRENSIIPLVDGRNITIAQLAEEYRAGIKNQVWSVKDRTHELVVGNVVWCDRTRVNSQICRVTFDDSSHVDSTPDHLFRLRDGSTKKAIDLSVNDSLMPFYRDPSLGFYDPSKSAYVGHLSSDWTASKFPIVSPREPLEYYSGFELGLTFLQANNSVNGHESAPVHSHNHKVLSVELLNETADVYCMEVLGPNGEHDRHNFAILGVSQDGTPTNNSGIFVENCKYGDLFLYCDVSPAYGVVSAFPIPVNEMEREENYDREDPFAVRYRWVTLGNRVVENWEVCHFRLLGNDMFLPYGSSIIEPARRIWRQLILIEDAMLVYRVVRAPERRVFYVDVGNIPPEQVKLYVEEQRRNLRTSQVVDSSSGRVDLRYNPMSVDEDYYIPVRGQESGTRIETLAGGQNTAAVEDVAYIQKKLFAALKVPRAYLGYDEALASKASLAQEDIRFSRTVAVIQKTMLAELNKLAIIHLYAHGFDGDDLQNFSLRLSNPSTIAQQQKLELWRQKFEIGGSMPEGMGSREFVQREIWGLNTDELKQIVNQRYREKIVDAAIETTVAANAADGGDAAAGGGGGEGETGADDVFADIASDTTEPAGGAEPAEEPEQQTAADDPGDDVNLDDDTVLLISSDKNDDEKVPLKWNGETPIKPTNQLKKALYNRSRRRHNGVSKTATPDFKKMTGISSHSMRDPYGSSDLSAVVTNPFGESARYVKPIITKHVVSTIASLPAKFHELHTANDSNAIITETRREVSDDDLFTIDVDLGDDVE